MRIAITTLLFALLVLVVWAGVAHPAAPIGEPFQIGVGTSVDVGENGLVVGFDGVPRDGRCAIGVYCFWEGDAATAMWAVLPEEHHTEFTLHTSAMFDRDAAYGGYVVTLLGLDPYPVYQKPTDPAAYVATVIVTRPSIITGAEQTTWGRIKALYTE